MPLRPYEVVYIIDPDLNAEETGAVVERFRALAEAQGAQELRVDTNILGRRRLAYEINHKREGQYVVMDFMAEPAAPAEVQRVLNITEGVLRSMVVRPDELPPEPAPAPEPAAAAPAPEPTPEPAAEGASEGTEPAGSATADGEAIAIVPDGEASEVPAGESGPGVASPTTSLTEDATDTGSEPTPLTQETVEEGS